MPFTRPRPEGRVVLPDPKDDPAADRVPTLALTHLRLVAFRSYARLDLDVTGRMIALTGGNGAGKTNVLEAVSLLAPGRGLRRASPADFARKQQGIGWSVSATVTAPADPVVLWTGAGEDGRRTAKQDDKATSVLALGRVARLLWLTPALDRVFVDGPGERRRFLDRMTLSLLPDHAETATRYDRAMRERNRVLKEDGDPRWLSALEGQMAEHGVALARGRAHALSALLGAQGEASPVPGAFPRAEAIITGEFDADMAAEDFARLLHDVRSRDAQAGRALTGPHRSDLAVRYAEKDAPAAECSTGEQKGLLVSLVLANARALHAETGAAPILLLDEIAAHFDENRRAALFADIAALGAQAWMTGTEPGLFDAMEGAAQRLVVREDDGGSIVTE